jgi:hypothetical protein
MVMYQRLRRRRDVQRRVGPDEEDPQSGADDRAEHGEIFPLTGSSGPLARRGPRGNGRYGVLVVTVNVSKVALTPWPNRRWEAGIETLPPHELPKVASPS